MVTFYRVLPYVDGVKSGSPGHPLYVPSATGSNRVDNPGVYEVLYLGDNPLCAVAEAFGWASRWNAGLLRGSPSLPGSVRALVEYEFDTPAPVCDLDDAHQLIKLDLRPSRVVTRDRAVTQGWARKIYQDGGHAGVRWWSYYNPDWGSIGLWDSAPLRVTNISRLTLDHPAFVAASEQIVRIIE